MTFKYYSTVHDDGFSRVVHALEGKQPSGAKEITEAEAAQIAKDVRGREPKSVSTPVQIAQPSDHVDLTSIKNQLDAHAKMLVEQAHTLDSHETKINATQSSVAEYLQGVKSGKPS